MTHNAAARRGGFSFVELLFAVMVLGFGMIAVAAALNVSTGMTLNTVDDTTAARLARNAEPQLASIMTQAAFPSTDGALRAFNNEQYALIEGNMAQCEDPRYGWIPFYIRQADSQVAQVVVVVVRARASSQFTAADFTPNSVSKLATFVPQQLPVDLSDPSAGPITATFGNLDDPNDPNNAATKSIAPGTIFILNSLQLSGEPGRIYKVGAPIDAARNIWSLEPGFDTPGNYHGGGAFVIGRGYADPNNPVTGQYDGPSQAVAAYATFIALH